MLYAFGIGVFSHSHVPHDIDVHLLGDVLPFEVVRVHFRLHEDGKLRPGVALFRTEKPSNVAEFGILDGEIESLADGLEAGGAVGVDDEGVVGESKLLECYLLLEEVFVDWVVELLQNEPQIVSVVPVEHIFTVRIEEFLGGKKREN